MHSSIREIRNRITEGDKVHMNYRHELKFQVSDKELEILRHRLKPLMATDTHQINSSYKIRSLYFDDYNNSCMYENEDGIDNRQKYRIRIYNGDSSLIKLEKKMKYRGMTRKNSVKISINDCHMYLHGIAPPITFSTTPLEKDFYTKLKVSGMHPVSIVEYERTAFVEPRGNVRITFDRNISGSNNLTNFLDSDITVIPLLPKGQHILEIKYDELLPEYIFHVLNINTLQKTSFSKYYYSRTYTKN